MNNFKSNDPRGCQRSEELYLKGLKNKMELEGKADQIKKNRK